MSDELDRLIEELRHENELLFNGIGACVLATGKNELFIPDLILGQKIKVEIFRDPCRPFGFTVKVDKCI